jgi:hypothetical protein
MAARALEAANAQQTVLPTQTTGSALVIRLAEPINSIDAEIADVRLNTSSRVRNVYPQSPYDNLRSLLRPRKTPNGPLAHCGNSEASKAL